MNNSRVTIVGRNVRVNFGKRAIDVPAKIDTGADSSSLWASKIKVGRDGVLSFALFGEASPYYSGKIFKRTDFDVAMVKSSTGHRQIRYKTKFTIKIKDKKIKAKFTLADRSTHKYPVLIGRRTIAGKFLVDVQQHDFNSGLRSRTKSLNKKLSQDPYKFYKKYHKNKN